MSFSYLIEVLFFVLFLFVSELFCIFSDYSMNLDFNFSSKALLIKDSLNFTGKSI